MPTCSLIQFGAVLIIFFYNPIVVYPVHSTYTCQPFPPPKNKKNGGGQSEGENNSRVFWASCMADTHVNL
jgi:hypothetical protein